MCFDLIVPPGQQANLRPIVRDARRHYLPVQAAWVPITQPVLVLRRRPNGPVLPASAKPAQFRFGGGEFAMQGSPLAPLGSYLENELDQPVVDETDLTGRYDAAFAVAPENLRASLDAALAKLGLEVIKAPREQAAPPHAGHRPEITRPGGQIPGGPDSKDPLLTYRAASMASCSRELRTLSSVSLLLRRVGWTRLVSRITTKSFSGSTQKYVPVKPVCP